MGMGTRIALRADDLWCHQECHAGRPLALATVSDGYQTALSN
jgi:hypothetical protein